MLRRVSALTTSSVAASSTALNVAPGQQQRSIGVHLPKADINIDKFEINKEMDNFRARTGRTPDHDMAKYRALYWRLDETSRRTERYIQNQGFFHLPILDFPVFRGCQPLFSAHQIRVHYGRHHRMYVDKLNTLIKDTPYDGMPLDAIIKRSAPNNNNDVAIFNNAAQHYNHCFFWKNIMPWGVNTPPDLEGALEAQYGSWDAFEAAFTAKTMGFFGSGWIWLVYDHNVDKFDILPMENALNPLTLHRVTPCLVLDAWEHSWYCDYENDKAKYVKNFLKCADWHWAERHWKRSTGQEYTDMKWQ